MSRKRKQPQVPVALAVLPPSQPADWTTALWILVTYLAVLAWGCVSLLSKWSWLAGQEIAPDRAVFSMVNAATLTGFPMTRGMATMQPPGQWTIAGLVLVGALLALWGGGCAVAAATASRHRPRTIGLASMLILVAAAIIGALTLSGEGPFLGGAFNGVSALANCALVMGLPPAPLDVLTHTIRLPLAILGGFGIVVMLDLLDALRGRPISRHSGTMLLSAACVYLASTAILWLIQLMNAALHSLKARDVAWVVMHDGVAASAWSLASRTAGFLPGISSLPHPGQWFIVLLMAIGATTGGTAGGIKSNTFAALARALADIWRGKLPGRVAVIAAAALFSWMFLTILCLLGLLATTDALPPDRLLLLSVSAVSNVGISFDPVTITGPGLFILSGAMLLGRLMPLTMLWWLTRIGQTCEYAVG